jgi:hypothetical protein
MKNILISAIAILALVACQGPTGPQGATGPRGLPAISVTTILSNWVNVEPNSSIPALNLSGVVLGTPTSVTPVINCSALLNGEPDESGQASYNGLPFNEMEITVTGDGTTGTIAFSGLAHADHSPTDVCYVIGGEVYDFTIAYDTDGNAVLTIVDPAYPQYASQFIAQ